MADFSVSPNITPVISSSVGKITRLISGYSGAAINAGQMVYLMPNGQYGLTLSTDVGMSVTVGMCLDTAPGPDQPISIAVSGDLILNNILVIGQVAVLGSAAGAITITLTDVTTGWYPGLVGIAVGVFQLRLAIANNNGIAHG